MREPASKRSFEESINEIEDNNIPKEYQQQITLSYLLPVSEFKDSETKFFKVAGKYFRVLKKTISNERGVKLQLSQASNLIYDGTNSSIIPSETSTEGDYVVLYKEKRTIDNRSEYFVDFYQGFSQFYKINNSGDREKVKKSKMEDQLITVTEKEEKGEKSYKVQVDPLALPTKNVQHAMLFELNIEAEKVFNTQGKNVNKKLTKELIELKGEEIDLKALLENNVETVPEVGYFTGYFNSLVAVSDSEEFE